MAALFLCSFVARVIVGFVVRTAMRLFVSLHQHNVFTPIGIVKCRTSLACSPCPVVKTGVHPLLIGGENAGTPPTISGVATTVTDGVVIGTVLLGVNVWFLISSIRCSCTCVFIHSLVVECFHRNSI